MARLTLPSRLELNRPDGSASEAPLAKVVFTTFLYVSPVQINPWCDQTGMLHFHSSTTESLAAAVAEDMVVYLRRSPRDPELSPFLVHRRHLHGTVHRVQDAITAEPERDWNRTALAALGQVTERHLLRLFTDHAGMSPLHYLQAIGLERARQSPEHSANVTDAAEAVGFRSDLHLRRAWGRQWGGSPRDAVRADGDGDGVVRVA